MVDLLLLGLLILVLFLLFEHISQSNLLLHLLL